MSHALVPVPLAMRKTQSLLRSRLCMVTQERSDSNPDVSNDEEEDSSDDSAWKKRWDALSPKVKLRVEQEQQQRRVHVDKAQAPKYVQNRRERIQEKLYNDEDVPWKKNARWKSLSPSVKLRVMEEAQERAVANKQKREPKQDQKRRMMMFVKKKQAQKKRAAHIQRPLPFDQRTPLNAIVPNTQLTGTVISLTKFGAYIDVGTECDGLLHVSQISRDVFVEHPREVLSPGDEVQVRVKSLNPDLKKLHLTMLPLQQIDDDDDDEARIGLEEVQVDDELWGEIKRVTAFGGYVELGAAVDGFLHFMDHPQFGASPGAPPSDFMSTGDRIRIWVTDVNREQNRIKLTANRPQHLPGPRREVY